MLHGPDGRRLCRLSRLASSQDSQHRGDGSGRAQLAQVEEESEAEGAQARAGGGGGVPAHPGHADQSAQAVPWREEGLPRPGVHEGQQSESHQGFHHVSAQTVSNFTTFGPL